MELRGFETPDPLDAKQVRYVCHGPRESDGEPLTCINALSGSRRVGRSLTMLAPPPGSPWPLWREEGFPMTGQISSNCFREVSAVASRALGLAIRAAALADAIDSLHRDILAAQDEPVRHAGFRCDAATSWAKQAGDELAETADHLKRVAAATKPGGCMVRWGVCPEHDNTLTSSGRNTWCRAAGCRRTWNYDRVGLHCIEPARWQVTDQLGTSTVMCNGHALDARARLKGARVELREEFV
jgi:hypothetical protein